MGKFVKIRNPRTGEFDYEVEFIDEQTLRSEVQRLRDNQKWWFGIGVAGRAKYMVRFQESLGKYKEEIVNALAIDTGRMRLCHMETEAFQYMTVERSQHAIEVLQENSGISTKDPEVSFEQQLVPYALLGVISPWNYPFILSFLDALPALLAGCAVAIKPSEVTPRFIEPVKKAIAAVPEIAKVLTIFAGDGAIGSQLVELADAVVFTGSVETGKKVSQQAAKDLKPAFLELGGKDPAVVLPGADLDAAADAIARGGFDNSGQICFSTERVYVHASQYEEFLQKLVDRATTVKLSYPEYKDGHIGPIIHAPQTEIISKHLEDAKAKGARILTGGEIENLGGGLWLKPTVICDVNHDMLIMQDETFAPILPVMSYETVEQAIALANDTRYGLSASVYGDEKEAVAVARQIDAGGLYVNDMDIVGKVYLEGEKMAFKDSGLGGTRYGPNAFMRYITTKLVVKRSGKPASVDIIAES
ncbi:MAG: aldehyde dehydrogenase family protein [Rhodospirillales bacterium]